MVGSNNPIDLQALFIEVKTYLQTNERQNTFMSSIWDFEANDSLGNKVQFSKYKGKVLLIVNTASNCTFTPQLKGLQSIYEEYKDRGFEIIGFPSSEFGDQEFEKQEEITTFCRSRYHITFAIMEKTIVNGKDALPLYGYIKEQKPGIMGLKRIKWNFEKFLVARDGKVVDRFSSLSDPLSISSKIENLLV